MLKDSAESLQRDVWTCPRSKGRVKGFHDIVQDRKVAIMQAAPPDEFPYTFNRIEFRAVRRQKIQTKMIGHIFAPSLMQVRMVVAGVVDNHHGLSIGTAALPLEFLQEIPAGDCIKHSFGLRHNQFASLQAYRAKKANALSGRRMEANRIADLRRNPHATTRAVLLKVNFVHRPEIDFITSREQAEFFYAWLVTAGRLGQPGGAACAIENPIAGRAADIDAPSNPRRACGAETRTKLGHPTAGSQDRTLPDWSARPFPLPSVVCRSNDWDVLRAGLRSDQPTRGPQSAAPSSLPCEENLPKLRQPGGKSCLGPQAALRAVDDHSVKRHCAESRPGEP